MQKKLKQPVINSTKKLSPHGYPGVQNKNFEKMQDDTPEKIIEKVAKGMLPKINSQIK